MVFKLSVGLLALAATVSAASFKRVACPDGKHTATNAACCVFFSLAEELQTNKFSSECSEDGTPTVPVLGSFAVLNNFDSSARGSPLDVPRCHRFLQVWRPKSGNWC